MKPKYNDDIAFTSLIQDYRGYGFKSLKGDLMAGLNVALVTVPQSMAYALVAGLPLSCGLLGAIILGMIVSLFGSSRHLVVGPNNAVSVLIQLGTAEILFQEYRGLIGPERELMALNILLQLGLLVGLFQSIAAFFKLGRLTQFVSHSVMVGYLMGTAFALVVGQLFPFSGVPFPNDPLSLFSKFTYFLTHIFDMHFQTLFLGSISLVIFVSLKGLFPKLPIGVLMLVFATGLAGYLGNNIALVKDQGAFEKLTPVFQLPFVNLALLNTMFPIAFAIALLSAIETSMAAKSVTAQSGQRLSVNQEIFGLGLANFFASLFGGMPGGGSVARSSMMYTSGGKTHFAGFFSAMWVALIVVIFSSYVGMVPLTALSAILLYSATQIVRWEQFALCFKATPSDRLVLMSTFLSCILLSLDVAFYVGVALSVTLYLKKAAVPYLVECRFDESGQFDSLGRGEKRPNTSIRMINVQGELFFGAADLFQSMLRSMARGEEKVIILRLKNARDLDASACHALEQLSTYLRSEGRYLLACGIGETTWDVLASAGTVQVIGKENLFITDEREPRVSLQQALKRARFLISDYENSSSKTNS